jgi:hypothetical protein
VKVIRLQPARDCARRWLLEALESGPVTAEALRCRAHRAGIAWRTVQRAAVGVIEARKIGFRRSHWVWTKSAAPAAEECHGKVICQTCGAERGGSAL